MAQPLVKVHDVSLEYRTRQAFFRHAEVTALRDVSFWIHRGETLGIVGGNGSGKSTLLRVLAEIYKPDSGQIIREYRSVMLLALALGFLGELSGRENALLSGVLLGGSIRTVRSRMPKIVEFSGLGHYIDKPLKTYSSGMRARLGFSVAIIMEAELLLIDEVMSVGDRSFRNKAEAAISDRAGSDQTIVLVSHSPAQIANLCNRAIWLNGGRVEKIGSAHDVVEAYKSSQSANPKGTLP